MNVPLSTCLLLCFVCHQVNAPYHDEHGFAPSPLLWPAGFIAWKKKWHHIPYRFQRILKQIEEDVKEAHQRRTQPQVEDEVLTCN
jgi:hypothetical protein